MALSCFVNEVVRGLLRPGLWLAGQGFSWSLNRRIRRFSQNQERLGKHYGLDSQVPVVSWGDEVERSIGAFAASRQDVRFALTSGSTSQPKRLAFTPERLRLIKRANLSAAARTLVAHGVRRCAMFVLASSGADDSLTSLLLEQRPSGTRWLDGLVMPSRYLSDPALKTTLERHGATAVRLWLVALCDPGLIYSTNPSTLAVFLEGLRDDWPGATAVVREFLAGTADPSLTRVARRVAGRGWKRRLCRLADSKVPLGVEAWAPGLRCWCAWDGGYVRPFLERVRAELPQDQAAFVPMYSMSTETVETLTWFSGQEVRFLPLAPHVCYEFIAEADEDRAESLVPATGLEAGGRYAMVVSDPWGLRRYQTDDLFECVGHVGEVPDLRFLRRRSLTYSFTGEKLTGQQVEAAFEKLREEDSALREARLQMTLIPSSSPGAAPHYRLALAHPGATAPEALDPQRLAECLDQALSAINAEFAAKLESGRLGASQALVMPYAKLAALLDGGGRGAQASGSRGWESQFKLLPLTRRLWEDLG